MRPRMLVLSHVLPFPGDSGQQQRVRNTLRALRSRFHVTFATFSAEPPPVAARLAEHCDESIVLPSLYARSRLRHGIAARLHRLRTGLKLSNYVIGELEFARPRVAALLEGRRFDCALFEYFHAARSTEVLHMRGIPCVLDMHNVLWNSYERHQDASPRAVRRYARHEERAWQRFDGLITINAEEDRYVRERARPGQSVWLTPMGVELDRWPYLWSPADPPRLAYYGGLSSAHNQQDALRCAVAVMPRIWAEVPDAQLWIVGNRPPPALRELERDTRIRVTGFVAEVQDVLRTATALLCPWSGTYGFRSRLVEVMALGVPVVTTADAVHGMPLREGRGLLLAESDEAMAEAALLLIRDPEDATRHSRRAREQVEAKLSFPATYGRLADELAAFVRDRANAGRLDAPPRAGAPPPRAGA